MPRVPEFSAGQIGRIADLHAQHPKGEAYERAFWQPLSKAANLPGANLNSQRLARRAKPRDGFRSNAGLKRHPSRLFFEYFLLAI